MGMEGQILAQYKKELANSQHRPTTARAALQMMTFPSLEVCKQGQVIAWRDRGEALIPKCAGVCWSEGRLSDH